ncbi:MAG: hypothetical protein IJE04_04005 [Bacilli bacterium]|nr:hypothetical protein [Bacilli bacterium]
MLDDFNLEQNIVYKILINSVKNNKYSHAYLIETNGYSKGLDLGIAFAKYLLCPNSYSNNKKCGSCSQCKNIDKNEFIELKIIDPEGQWIKKSQLEELQEIFSKKSVLGNKKVYIINKAEKLNPASSNSLLKFLEEPEEGIVAILITENIHQLLSTIVSRCQVLSLKNKINLDNFSTKEKIAHYLSNNKEDIENFINNEDNIVKIEKVIEFIKYYEDNHLNTLIYINKIWNEIFKDKQDIYNAFTILLLFYKDVLNLKLGKGVQIFTDYVNEVNNLEEKNNLDEITNKINVIMDLREKIKFNVNNNLLMDKLIIQLGRCDVK